MFDASLWGDALCLVCTISPTCSFEFISPSCFLIAANISDNSYAFLRNLLALESVSLQTEAWEKPKGFLPERE